MRILLFCSLALILACKQGPSDKDVENEVKNKISSTAPGVVASVHDGVVTLSGTCPDDPCKTNSEAAVRNTKGVKQVVNNIIVSPPPAPNVEVTSSDTLQTSLNRLLSAYKTVNGKVEDGVITLSGEIKRSQLTPLMQSVNELKPKRVVNNMEIK
jgi:hyperosmotically inducible periplasmic protein